MNTVIYFSHFFNIVQIGTSSNLERDKHLAQESVFRSREAVTSGKTEGGYEIPIGHPILTDLKVPKYVEGIKYYEDTPSKHPEVEAVSIDKLDDAYYKPFQAKYNPIINRARTTSNCEDISSLYVCGETRFCMWDNLIRTCVFVKSYSFKQKNHHRK